MLKDTRRAYNDLTSAGLDPTAANVIVDLLHERDEEVATKQDIQLLKQDIELLRKEIELVRSDAQTGREQLRIQMNRTIRNWVGGVGGLIALLITIFEFLGA